MKNQYLKKVLPLILFFVVVNLALLVFRRFLFQNDFNINFIFVANLVLCGLSFFGIFIQTRGVRSSNIHAFIRGVYSSLLMKMFVIIAAVFIYIFVTGGKVNKPALFASMAIYLVYTFLEVSQLMKIARKKSDA
jgi:hypothetical protein